MSKITVTMKMEKGIHKGLKNFCEEKGYIIGSFVEKAVIEKLEKEELAEDLASIAGFESDKNKLMVSETAMKRKLGI